MSAKEIFKVCMISRCFMKASKEPGVWEVYFPDQKRLQRLIKEESEAAAKRRGEARTIKAMLMDELNVVSNLTQKKRYMTLSLVGHQKHITSLDIKGRLVVSGSHDNAVKVWDLQKKRGVSFDHHRGHINWVTQVMVWDDSSVLSAGADRTIRYWDLGEVE
jgi:hypothetical protein